MENVLVLKGLEADFTANKLGSLYSFTENNTKEQQHRAYCIKSTFNLYKDRGRKYFCFWKYPVKLSFCLRPLTNLLIWLLQQK